MSEGMKVIILDADSNRLDVSLSSAQKIADDKGLDLVKVNQKQDQIVYKIMDHGKWKYNKSKQKKQSKQVHKSTKEVRFNVKTDKHDQDIKIERIRRFLSKGHDVRVVVRMSYRENLHPDLAKEKLSDILLQIDDIGKCDKNKIECAVRQKGKGHVGVVVYPESAKDKLNVKKENKNINNQQNRSTEIPQ